MSDLIDRAEAISRAVELRMYGKPVKMVAVSELERLPAVRAEHGKTTLPEQADSDRLGVKTGETCADVISRQAAIEVIDAVFPVDPMKSEYAQGIACGAALAKTYVEQLPSAQAEERTEERTETHACDCISRQAAIDAISCDITVTGRQNAELVAATIGTFADRIKALPSAQPSGKDPIEREAVVEILHEAMQNRSESEENLIGEIVCKVDLLPSAQAEIIRCRECRHSEHWYRDKARCFLWHEEGIDVFEDGYCSYAERRTDADMRGEQDG